MNQFCQALTALNPSSHIPPQDNWFAPLIGHWDFEWIDKKGDMECKVPGEWIFSWIIEGCAIQDVFICPSRPNRQGDMFKNAAYGTTLCWYNAQEHCWEAVYADKESYTTLKAQKDKSDIVLTCTNCEGYQMKWIFSDITSDNFHWRNIISNDNGENWTVAGQLFASRRRWAI